MAKVLVFRHVPAEPLGTLDPMLRYRGHRIRYVNFHRHPDAQPQAAGGLNYIRNSAKVVIDAYNGTVDFYVSEPGDPLIQTYQRIFPDLFKPLAAMPADLQRHIRYPEDLFLVQAELYRAYHMETAEVFYNREDLWQFPRQSVGLDEAPAVLLAVGQGDEDPEDEVLEREEIRGPGNHGPNNSYIL